MSKDTIWNIILIVSIILLIHGMSNVGDKDKKAAQAAQSETAAGGLGAVVSLIAKKTNPVVWALVALFASMPFVAGNWLNFFRDLSNPSPSIPSWIWVAGFIVLALMVMRRR